VYTQAMPRFDATLPPIRLHRRDLDRYRLACERAGMSVSQALRLHILRTVMKDAAQRGRAQ